MTLHSVLIQIIARSDLGSVGMTRHELMVLGGRPAVDAANHLTQLRLVAHAEDFDCFYPIRERGNYRDPADNGSHRRRSGPAFVSGGKAIYRVNQSWRVVKRKRRNAVRTCA